jgi:hypothetical protein
LWRVVQIRFKASLGRHPSEQLRATEALYRHPFTASGHEMAFAED